MTLATAEELASFLQRPTIDRATAEMLLDLAAGEVADEIGQPVEVLTTTETYDGLPADHPAAAELFLRRWPVTEVTEVTSDVDVLDPAAYAWSVRGRVVRTDGDVLSAALGGITVTYTAGWAQDTRQWRTARWVSLGCAARAYVNPGQLAEITVGSVTSAYPKENDGRTGRVELSRSERAALAALRRAV